MGLTGGLKGRDGLGSEEAPSPADSARAQVVVVVVVGRPLALQVDSEHPQEAGFVVPKAWQPMNTDSEPLGQDRASSSPAGWGWGWGGEDTALSPPGSPAHRQELWARSWKPRVLVLVPYVAVTPCEPNHQNGWEGCPGFLPVRQTGSVRWGKGGEGTMRAREEWEAAAESDRRRCPALGSLSSEGATACYAQPDGEPAAGL